MRHERFAWLAGVVFVIALLAESVISAGIPINQDASAEKIARALNEHRHVMLVAAYLSTVYAVAFVVYVSRLHSLLTDRAGEARTLCSLVLVGGVPMVLLHGTSDIGIYGLLGGKVAAYGADHDPGLSYTLYLLTYALDSVGDVFGSLFMVSAGVLIIRTGVLPTWTGRLAVISGAFLFLQGFGLGGVIGTYGLVLDLIGFVLFLAFVAISSVMLFRREQPA